VILDGVITWFKEVVNRMIGKASIKQALSVDIAMSSAMVEALKTWTLMYENKATWLNADVLSLNLPVAIASEVAREITIEMKVTIEGSPRATYLAEQFEKVMDKLRDAVEFGAAKGGLMMKPYVSEGAIEVDYVHADQFFPISFDAGGNIKACVFVDQRTVGVQIYTRLEYHELKGTNYIVKNKAYRSTTSDTLGQEVPLDSVDKWKGLAQEATIKNVTKPLFAYFRYPLANNIDSSSPLGVSCYARAVDLIKQADIQWSNLLWEFESGKRALYLDVLAFGKDDEGKPILPNKRLYRTLETGSMEGELFKEWTPNLREQNMINGLEAILRKIEFVCGIAYGTLSDPENVDRTATEIVASKQRSFATIVDAQKSLKGAIEQLLYAMDTWTTLKKLAPKGTYTTVYDFDDSIVVNKDMQFQQDLRLVSSQIMGRVEFRMRNMDEDEATATKMIAKATADQADLFEQEVKKKEEMTQVAAPFGKKKAAPFGKKAAAK